jgi:hypothetical protein
VLGATARSKAVLRAAVDEVLATLPGCDYFPSYEIATQNPLLRDAFGPDQREVREEVVERIMQVFFAGQSGILREGQGAALQGDKGIEVCDEVLLDAARG